MDEHFFLLTCEVVLNDSKVQEIKSFVDRLGVPCELVLYDDEEFPETLKVVFSNKETATKYADLLMNFERIVKGFRLHLEIRKTQKVTNMNRKVKLEFPKELYQLVKQKMTKTVLSTSITIKDDVFEKAISVEGKGEEFTTTLEKIYSLFSKDLNSSLSHSQLILTQITERIITKSRFEKLQTTISNYNTESNFIDAKQEGDKIKLSYGGTCEFCWFLSSNLDEKNPLKKESTPFNSKKDFTLDYDSKIGEGASCRVYLGVYSPKNSNPTPVAVKVIGLNDKNAAIMVKNEVTLLQDLPTHKNIQRAYCSDSDSNNYYIVLELGTPFDKYENYTKIEKIQIMKGVADGLEHLHKNNVIHRDIKPNNIVLKKTKELTSMIIDFGISTHADVFKTNCGTSEYKAPEFHDIATEMTEKVDIFALGCVFSEVWNGCHPFKDEKKSINLNIQNSIYYVSKDDFLFNDLIIHMLKHNPKQRYSIDQVVNHPFFWDYTRKCSFLSKFSNDYEQIRKSISIEKYRYFLLNWKKNGNHFFRPIDLQKETEKIKEFQINTKSQTDLAILSFIKQDSVTIKTSNEAWFPIRTIRNIVNHANDNKKWCEDIKKVIANNKNDPFLFDYFITKYPNLFYLIIKASETMFLKN